MIDAYARQAITITPKGTRKADGKYNFDGASVDTKAVVMEKAGLFKRAEGEEIVYNKIALLKLRETVSVGDRITYDSINHEVLHVHNQRGLAGGLRAIKVYLQ